jgi:uncharacterized protein
MRRSTTAAVLLGAAVWLAGCASSPVPSWHSLVPAAVAARPASTDGAVPTRVTISIAMLTVPDEVDRPQLVLRSADGSLTVLENERWAEPLKAQLPRAIALSLGQRLPGAVVAAAPNAALGLPDWRVTIDVQRFELQRGAPDRALLRVLWSLRPAPAKETAPTVVPAPQVFEVSEPAASANPAALAAAMSVAATRLSGQIAQRLCSMASC